MPTPKTTITRTMHPTAMPRTGPELREDFTLLPGIDVAFSSKTRKISKDYKKIQMKSFTWILIGCG